MTDNSHTTNKVWVIIKELAMTCQKSLDAMLSLLHFYNPKFKYVYTRIFKYPSNVYNK